MATPFLLYSEVFLALFFMGLILGLMGGGGAILAFPIFVFLLKVPALEATQWSLLVVAGSAWFGSVGHLKNKRVDVRVALGFALPSILGAFVIRRYGLPFLPASLPIEWGGWTKDRILITVFAVVMLAAARSMLKKERQGSFVDPESGLNSPRFGKIFFTGVGVGALTGLIGAGGGFLIVPAFYRQLKMDLKRSMSTSLLVIALNASFSFWVGATQSIRLHLGEFEGRINFGPVLFLILLFSFSGMLFGIKLQPKVRAETLKKGFGVFVITIAMLMLFKEFGSG